MKNWKRVLAFLMCAAMVLTMSMTAFADSDDDDDEDEEDVEDYDVSDVSFDVSDSAIYVVWSVGESECRYSVQLYDSSDFKSKNKVGSESSVSYEAEKCDVTDKILKEGSGTYYAVVKCKKKASGDSYHSAWAKETISSDDISMIKKNRTSSSETTSSSSSSSSSSTSTDTAQTAHWNALDDGKWSYTMDNGSLAVGWYDVNGKWYYSGSDGIMYASAWIASMTEEGVWYYVGADGAMLTDSVTPDGYTVDADGRWKG